MIYKNFLSYEEAKKITSKLNLNSKIEWDNFCKQNKCQSDIPHYPQKTYKNIGWINWAEWLNTKNYASKKKISSI